MSIHGRIHVLNALIIHSRPMNDSGFAETTEIFVHTKNHLLSGMCVCVCGEKLCPHYDRNGWHEQSNQWISARNMNEHRIVAANVTIGGISFGHLFNIICHQHKNSLSNNFSLIFGCVNASDYQIGDSCPLSMRIYRKGKRWFIINYQYLSAAHNSFRVFFFIRFECIRKIERWTIVSQIKIDSKNSSLFRLQTSTIILMIGQSFKVISFFFSYISANGFI